MSPIVSSSQRRLRHREEGAEIRGTEPAARPHEEGASAMTSHPALRRVIPIVAGLAAVVAITTATDVLMHATGVFPPWGERMADGLFVLPLGYRVIYAVLG